MSREMLRKWINQVERGRGHTELMRLKELERENRELRTANEILRKASAYFAQAELDHCSKPWLRSSTRIVTSTVSSRSAECCRSRRRRIIVTPSDAAFRRNGRHARRDTDLKALIQWVWNENFGVSVVCRSGAICGETA